MAIHFEAEYVPAIVGLLIGGAVGYLVAGMRGPTPTDVRVTLSLLLGAATAHLFLIPVVERERQILFGLYFIALALTFGVALAGTGVWKLGAVLFPAGSILGYFYFAIGAHEVDYIGLLVKVVELGVIVAAARSVVATRKIPSAG